MGDTRLSWCPRGLAATVALLIGFGPPLPATAQDDATWNTQALQLEQQNDLPGVEALARRWTAERPASFPGRMLLAVMECRLGEVPDAVADYKRAADIDPSNPAPWKNLAACLGHSKDFPGAIAAAEQEVKLAPVSADAWSDLAIQRDNLAMKRLVDLRIGILNTLDQETKQDFEDAAAAMEKAIELGIANPGWAWNQVGGDYVWAEDYRRSINAYFNSLQLEPGNAYSLNGIAKANGGLKSVCTRTQTRPGAPGYVIMTRFWTCDAETQSLSERVDRLLGAR